MHHRLFLRVNLVFTLAVTMFKSSYHSLWLVFLGVNLKGSDLEGSQLGNVNLRVATLKGANLQNCNLRGAELAGADLEVRFNVAFSILVKIGTPQPSPYAFSARSILDSTVSFDVTDRD